MFKFKSNLLKFGYGYDISGEVNEGGGTSGQGKDLEDTQQPWTQHETGANPANVNRDSEAELDFPQIVRKPNIFPATRSK